MNKIWNLFEEWNESLSETVPWYVTTSFIVVAFAFVISCVEVDKETEEGALHLYFILSSLFALVTTGTASLMSLLEDKTLNIICVGVSFSTLIVTASTYVLLILFSMPLTMFLFFAAPSAIIGGIYWYVKRRK